MDSFLGKLWGDRIADRYDQFFGAAEDPGKAVEFLSETFGQSQRVIEVGVGTGRVAAALARAMPTVEIVGVDISPKMLARVDTAGVANLRTECLDITAGTPSGPFDAALIVFNTLFMLGPPDMQKQALKHVRDQMTSGDPLVVDVFEPRDPFYNKPSLRMTPLHMTSEEVLLTVTQVSPEDRVVRSQDIYLSQGDVSLAPSVFHYVFATELDHMAAQVGWQLTKRISDWSGSAFDPYSDRNISVYRAV